MAAGLPTCVGVRVGGLVGSAVGASEGLEVGRVGCSVGVSVGSWTDTGCGGGGDVRHRACTTSEGRGGVM